MTHAEIAAAIAEYLARGGTIARLPDEPQPPVPAVRLNEEMETLRPVPWEEVMVEEGWE